MELTKKQYEGLKIAVSRYKNHEKHTVISGYAGTGKSTLVNVIIEALDLDESKVCFACYTGKAAEVLRKKGNKNAITLHKLLYESVPKPDGTFFRRKKASLEYNFIVIDECSMVPLEMVKQLNSYMGVYVIYLGDPFQIPPIDKDADNHLLDAPHVFLDEIMRQAADSEIIRVSMDIRAMKPLQLFKGNDVQILNKYDLNTGMLKWADQILVATNNTRININDQMRSLYGHGDKPQNGDKMICRRNYWDMPNANNEVMVNGTIGYLNNSYESMTIAPLWQASKRVPTICGNIITDSGEEFRNLQMDKNLILTGKKTLSPKEEYRLFRNPKFTGVVPMEFEYGYAITTHRAQGSQWDKVLVIEEKFPFNAEEHARHLYTSVTRAAEKCVIVRK